MSSWLDNASIPRKFDALSKLMNKQQCTTAAVAGRRAAASGAPNDGVQFFVRTIGGAGRRTVTIRGMDPFDTIASINCRIEAVTGIPRDQQQLIYQGRQLDLEKSVAECNITRDATLEMTSRLRSFRHPQAWQWVDNIVSGCLTLCRGGGFSSKTLNYYVSGFFTKTLFKQKEKGVVEEDIRFSAFLALSAPTALVMLYLSPIKANKEIADECIRAFIQSVKGFKLDTLPHPYYYKFAPIVLEFCRLLRWRVANDDPIYDCLRSCLGWIVKSIEFEPFKLLEIGIGIHDVFPFVCELAAKLSDALGSMAECTMSSGPAENHVCDFSSFVRHCGFIFRNVELASVGAGPFVDGIRFLHSTFYDLMEKVDLCLERLEEHLVTSEKGKGKEKAEPHCLAWGRFLTILRELNGMSKMFKDGVAEEFFWVKINQRKAALSNIVVRFAKRDENNEWLYRRKEVLDFAARRHLALLLLPEMKDEYGPYEMLIDRSHLLAESFEYIANVNASSLLNRLFMKFKDEEATGPGVLREWFFLVCQEIFNPQNALFVACPNDHRRYFPNSASKVNPMHLDYFKFAGRIIALAFINKIQVGVVFDRVFALQLAGKGVSLEDIQDADPYLYSSCKQILAMDPDIVDQDALCLTFVREIEELGSRKVVELCNDGHNIAVNSRNRKNYVDRLIEHHFVTSVSDQINKFKDGFASVVKYPAMISFFQSLDIEDLNWTLHGSESDISVEDWRAHTEYKGYQKSDPEMVWFWNVVGNMSNEQKKVLLFFWTSIKHLPVEGFGGLASSLYIYKTPEPQDRLPSSRTCFFRLCFPAYTSMAMMKARLSVITQEHVGCSFGAQ